MSHHVNSTGSRHRLLVLAGAAAIGGADAPLRAAEPPAEIRIAGILRDFYEGHADFAIAPPEGLGHYAGQVATTIGAGDLPTFVPAVAGGTITTPSTNMVAWWKLDDGSGVAATDAIGDNDGALANGPAWVSGVTGEALVFDGVDDYVEIASDPSLAITGDVSISGWFRLDDAFDRTSTTTQVLIERIADDQHNMHIALVGTDYSTSDVADGSLVFKIENHDLGRAWQYKWTNRTIWNAGAWYHFVAVLSSSDPDDNRILINGVDDTATRDISMAGVIHTDYSAPFRIGGRKLDSTSNVADERYFKGAIDDIRIYRTALVEQDVNPEGGYRVTTQWTDSANRGIAPHMKDVVDACGAVSDTRGVRGASGNGGVSSATTFDEWFRDVPSTNLSCSYPLVLAWNEVSRTYAVNHIDWRPADGLLLGNEGDAHNHNFTYSFRADFTYAACDGQYFTAGASDGLWVFIDDRLVIDGGGMENGLDQRIDLDRLELVDGEAYRLDFFCAERHDASSKIKIQTNLQLFTDAYLPSITQAFD